MNHRFLDPSLLQTALTHPSFSAEAKVPSNQRLEFLGDAVLKMVVAETLYAAFPDWPEGHLSTTLARLVGNQFIAGLARERGLGAQLRLGKGASKEGVGDRENVLADSLEALIGAVYLDGGLDAVRLEFSPQLLGQVALLDEPKGHPKTQLQEREAKAGRPLPEYRHLGTEGADHERLWVADLRVDGRTFGPARGASKRAAETELARLALADG